MDGLIKVNFHLHHYMCPVFWKTEYCAVKQLADIFCRLVGRWIKLKYPYLSDCSKQITVLEFNIHVQLNYLRLWRKIHFSSFLQLQRNYFFHDHKKNIYGLKTCQTSPFRTIVIEVSLMLQFVVKRLLTSVLYNGKLVKFQ